MPIQGQAYETVLQLSTAAVPYTDVLVSYRRQGSSAFTIKPLALSDWSELPGNLYVLKLSGSDLSTVGSFLLVVGTPSGDVIKELEVTPNLPGYTPRPGICVVSGNIVDIGGNPSPNQPIMFRVAKSPSTLGGAFVAGSRLPTMPDAYGSFSMALVRNAKVIVEIEGAGIRQQITVPDADTANLIDLLPPITN